MASKPEKGLSIMTKFNDEPTDAKDLDVAPESESAAERRSDDVPMIVYREPYRDENGAMTEKIHGPMPVEDWPAYEKEHGL